MNHFFYETRGKEKVRDLLEEGQRSQSFYRSGAARKNPLSILAGLAGMIFGGWLKRLDRSQHRPQSEDARFRTFPG